LFVFCLFAYAHVAVCLRAIEFNDEKFENIQIFEAQAADDSKNYINSFFRTKQRMKREWMSVVRNANFSSMTLLKIHRLKCLSKVQFLSLPLHAISVCAESTSSHFNSIKLVIWYFGNCYADPLRAPVYMTQTYTQTHTKHKMQFNYR
jgi:hypothetical protein